MPHQPRDYVSDWRAIQKQQSAFNEDDIKMFEKYEVELKECDRSYERLGGLHIGGVTIAQVGVKER